QLADAKSEPRGTLWEDAMLYRMFPGEGELPIVDILRTIRETQDIRSIGPEILSIEINAMSPEEAGRRSSSATQNVMVQAGYRGIRASRGPLSFRAAAVPHRTR